MRRARRLRQREADPDRVREMEHRKLAARRARKAGAATVARIDRLAVFERDGWRCHYCRLPVDRGDAHLAHIVALARGGTHTLENVACSHAACNMADGTGRLPAQLRLIG